MRWIDVLARPGRGAWAPHTVGENDDDREKNDEDEGWRVVRHNKRKRVHGSVKDGDGEKIGAGTVIEPGEDESDGDEEDDAEQNVSDQSEAKGTVKVERGVPQRPRKPHEEAREKRREALLEMREKKAAPAGLFERGSEKEIAEEGNATVSGVHAKRSERRWLNERRVQETRDGGGNKQDNWPEEKGEPLPRPVGGMNEGAEKLADARVAGESAGENPGGEHCEERDNGIVEERGRSVDAAEPVVGNVGRPGEKPKDGEREKARGETIGDFGLAVAGKKDSGKCRPSGAKGCEVFAAIGTNAEKPSSNPHEPGDGVSQK